MTPRRALTVLAVTFVATFAVYSLVAQSAKSWDLTSEGSATLSDETRRVLDGLDRRVEITAFFAHDAIGRVEAATLLERYRRANRRVTFRILDPVLAPGEASRLGIEQSGSAAVQDVAHPKSIEIAQFTIEIDVTSAIARLLRGDQGTVCFTTGHGELSMGSNDPTGLSDAAAILRANGYNTRDIDLLVEKRIPSSCTAVVVAAPTNAIVKRARRLLSAYLDDAGKAILLGDPSSSVDLTPISKPWGIRFEQGIVLEGDDHAHLPDDVTAPIVTRYEGASPVVRGLGPTFMPRAMGLRTKPSKQAGLSVGPIALTSPLGYLDRDEVSSFDPKVDVKGPIALGAAADASEVVHAGTARAHIRRTRVLAWGDAHWATNTFIADGSNARLWIQGIDWLTQPEDLVTAVPNFPHLRDLDLTAARSRYMLFLMAGVVPGLFVIAGAFVWVLRRSR